MKKTDDQILKSGFDDLNEDEQKKFLELKTKEVDAKFGTLVPKNARTHTIVLENGLGCILNHPKPNILSKVLGALSGMKDDPDMYKAGNFILNNCWVAGDLQILDNDDFRFACAIQTLEMVEILQGSIKKN